MLHSRYTYILIFIISSITFLSCKKNIEIDENGIYIKNGIKSEIVITKVTDNRIENLRILTHQQNQFNSKAKGYSWHKKGRNMSQP